jgi:protein Mpv17
MRTSPQAPVRLSSTAGPQMVLGGMGRSFMRAVRSSPRINRLPPGMGKGFGIGMGMGNDGGDGIDMSMSAGDGDSEPSNPVVAAWKNYEQLLDTKPLLMKMLTSMTGFAIGDILAQVFITKGEFDWARLIRLTSFGFLVHGSSSHWFYGMLDGKIPGKGAVPVFSKVFIDQVLWNPIFGIMFFSYVAAFELKGFDYVKDKVQNELLVQVTGSWKVWPLAHAINFRFIPSSQRVLYINTIQIGYNCFLSIISNR